MKLIRRCDDCYRIILLGNETLKQSDLSGMILQGEDVTIHERYFLSNDIS
jgi:hypothetical protein